MSTNDTTTTPDPTPISPNWASPVSVLRWLGEQIEEQWAIANRGQKLTSDKRIRALTSLIDSWSRCFKLVSDTSVVSELSKKLDELKAAVDEQQRSGPRGIVKGGD